MKILVLSGSQVGTRTRTVMDLVAAQLRLRAPDDEVTLLDLADKDMQFSDGRNWLDYRGDTGDVARAVMEADTIIIGTPVFHASIPAALKNVFDLLPQNALRHKVVGIVVTAGSAKHYLIPQMHLVPVLAYMKAQVVQPYVFIEERDIQGGQLLSDDARLRLDRLVEDTLVLSRTHRQIRQAEEDAYGF